VSDAGSGEISDLDRLQALITARRWDAAEQTARTAVAHHPRHYYPMWGLSVALLGLGRVADAREAAEAAVALAPDVFWNPMQLSDVALAQRDQPVALEAAHRSVELAPISAQTHRRVAYACGLRSAEDDPGSIIDSQGALAAIARAMQLQPNVADDHRFRASILEGLGRRSEAAKAYRAALALDPARHESVNNLALLHLPRRPILAASLFRESARLDPSCPNPRRNLTSAVHAALFRFAWALLAAGIASVALRTVLGPMVETLLLGAGVLAGTLAGVRLWRVLPAGARTEILRHRWRAGLLFVGLCAVVISADLALILAGTHTREWCLASLITIAALLVVLPRSPWSGQMSRRLGTWLVPAPRAPGGRGGSSVDPVSR
jgi:tetratricopeptide (TPR) repeat protein